MVWCGLEEFSPYNANLTFQVTLVKWNEPYQKLASCDSTGIIFVWIKVQPHERHKKISVSCLRVKCYRYCAWDPVESYPNIVPNLWFVLSYTCVVVDQKWGLVTDKLDKACT
jgi:hypothetical protein